MKPTSRVGSQQSNRLVESQVPDFSLEAITDEVPHHGMESYRIQALDLLNQRIEVPSCRGGRVILQVLKYAQHDGAGLHEAVFQRLD
jgi:hypothetical protein